MDDPETETRKMACCMAENIAARAYENGQFILTDAASFIACAQEIEHYISDGQDVAFTLTDGRLAKVVR